MRAIYIEIQKLRGNTILILFMHQNEIHLMNLVADIDLHILASDTTALNLETHIQFSKLTKKNPPMSW